MSIGPRLRPKKRSLQPNGPKLMWLLRPQFITRLPAQRLFQCTYPLLGLTGGIACGKSLALSFFKPYALTFSADTFIKQIYARPATLEFLQKIIPEALKTTTANPLERINWQVLRAKFFTQEALATQIEQYLYAQLPAIFNQALAAAPPSAPHVPVIFEVPLLFERGWDAFVDQTIAVSTAAPVQRQRLAQQRHLTPSEIDAFLQRQLSPAQKAAQANFTLHNDGTPAELQQQCQALATQLFQQA